MATGAANTDLKQICVNMILKHTAHYKQKSFLVNIMDGPEQLTTQAQNSHQHLSTNWKKELLPWFEYEMSQEGRSRPHGCVYTAAREDTVTDAAGKQLRQDAKRPTLVLITHAGTVHCVQLHTYQHKHRLTSVTYTYTHSRWLNQPACFLWLLKARCQRC